MKTDNNVEAQQEVNSGKAEAAQKQHGVNQGHTASEAPYERAEFTAPAAASAPSSEKKKGATPRTTAFCLAEELGDLSDEQAFHSLLAFTIQLERELAAAINRERLANMRADQAEEARDAAQSATVASDTAKLVDALRHILWIKDCGVDGRDEHGAFRNFPETERDAMYDIAKKAIADLDRTKA